MFRFRFRDAARIGAILTILAMVIVIAGCRSKDSAGSGDASSRGSQDSSMTVVRLVDGSEFYGRQSTVVNGLLALDDVYFVSEAAPQDGGSGKLRRFGNEIYRPLPQLLIPSDAVLFEQPLAKVSAVVKGVSEFEASNKQTPIPASAVPSGQIMAVCMRTGEVFFGRVSMQGATVRIDDAHYLRFRDKKAAKSDEIRSLDQLALAPQSALANGPTGEVRAPLSSVLYIQPLATDSPVVKALKAPNKDGSAKP